jgi:hypothetical protein
MSDNNNPFMAAAFEDQSNENKLALGMLYQQIMNKSIVPGDLAMTKAHFVKVFDIVNNPTSSSIQVASAMKTLMKSLIASMTPAEFDMSMMMYTMAAINN